VINLINKVSDVSDSQLIYQISNAIVQRRSRGKGFHQNNKDRQLGDRHRTLCNFHSSFIVAHSKIHERKWCTICHPPHFILYLLQRDEPRRVGSSDTGPTVLHRLVRDRKLCQVVSNHLGLHKAQCKIRRSSRKRRHSILAGLKPEHHSSQKQHKHLHESQIHILSSYKC